MGLNLPDFLLRTEAGFAVVDVKPEKMLTDPGVSAALDWAGRLCAAKGWRFEVWSGADPVVLRNVRFLASGRRTDPYEGGARQGCRGSPAGDVGG